MECQTNVSKRNIPFKVIIETIIDHFENPNDAKKLVDKINSNKVEVKKNKLRIGKPIQSKKNSKTLSNLMTNNNLNNDGNPTEINEENQIPESMNYLYHTIHNENEKND